jgi:hypothetical protein
VAYRQPRPSLEAGESMSGEDVDKESQERCSNPFGIPHHLVSRGLRNVPRLVRERFTHVNFGHKICYGCRKRVYVMLKERKQLKPSALLQAAGDLPEEGDCSSASSNAPEEAIQLGLGPPEPNSNLLRTYISSHSALPALFRIFPNGSTPYTTAPPRPSPPLASHLSPTAAPRAP